MADTDDFLVEIGTEELPPKALKTLANAFLQGMETGLMSAGLAHDKVTLFATPRRLALRIGDLARRQPDRAVERRGPPVKVAFDGDGNPTRAATAFADGCNVGVEALERIETPKGEWLVYRGKETGKLAAELLPDIVDAALAGLPSPKAMRWGSGSAEFVRPVHWVVMLHGSQVVPGTFFGIDAGQKTRGHRFHAPQPIQVAHPGDYDKLLRDGGYVVADFAERRAMVSQLIADAAAAAGGTAVFDEDLMDEVTALVEWPVAVTGSFETRFLELPPEVLIATLQDHQRYFPVRGDDGALKPVFITISNIESQNPDEVRSGNERVVRPRLEDAAFFWKADRQRSLASRLDDLGSVIFQRKLGTLKDKTHRVAGLTRYVAGSLGADVELAECAATMAKCDLLTDMVGEFPALQGTMGRYYALHDGTPQEVALAVEEQYLPRYAGDALPTSNTGRSLAIADKLDTITGIFAIGKRPTGTSDPFGLRRAALGVLRIIVEDALDLDLSELAWHAAASFSFVDDRDALRDEVYDYMMERLRAYYLDGAAGDAGDGVTAPMFDAVLARRPGKPLDFQQRLQAVREFAGLEASESLSTANKRIANILRGADVEVADQMQRELMTDTAELSLHDALTEMRTTIAPMLKTRDYREALVTLAGLREPVDTFFDDVLVMADDPQVRGNRLALLGNLRDLFLEIADLSRLQ